MNISDGSRLLLSKTEVKVVSCTRWAEMQQTVIYHAELAALLHAPTVFRLLNEPGNGVGNQQFSVAESKLDISRDLGIARSIISNPLVAHILEIRQIGRQLQDREVPELTNYFNSSDFLELGCCVVIFLMCVSVSVVNTVHQRPIPFQLLADGSYVENQVNSQDFTGETIPDWLLLLLAIIVPLLFQLGLSKFYGCVGDMHSTACAYVLGLGQTYLTVEFVKLYVGYPRPNFYSLCQPSANYSVCTAEGSDSGRKAFPSGHAAIAFCGLSLLTFFIQHRFGVPSQATPPRKARVYSILSLAPMALATFIAASRVYDNKHFPADVVGGAVLGTALSVFSHSLWYVNVQSWRFKFVLLLSHFLLSS